MIRQAVRRFWRREDGALMPLALQMLLMMIICIGITVDFVRQEELRTRIQNTLDRATLAAASLTQDLDPKAVVRDYIDKAGLGYLGVDPQVEEGEMQQWRRVTVSARDGVMTIFGPLIGIDDLAVRAASQAEESIGNVEISLVLDISGSMNYNINGRANGTYPTRMDQLRPAALNFVRKMFETVQGPQAPPGRLSISIVPYNQQVVLGTTLANAFTLSQDHTRNTCADVQILSDTNIAIDANRQIQRTMTGDSFDYWGYPASVPVYYDRTDSNRLIGIENCVETTAASVLAFGRDETDLRTKINALTPGGDTAIDVGARWGLALLDPAARPALDRLIRNDSTRATLSGRPFDYSGTGDESSMKVLVLMTDGENTRSYSTKPAYRTGGSPLWSTSGATAFSTSTSDWNNLYYNVPGRARPWYSLRYGQWYQTSDLAKLTQVSWPTVWSKGFTLQYVIDRFLYAARRSDGGTSVTKDGIYAEMAEQSEFGTKDAALRNLCATAKAPERDIYVFTVAVDAPREGVNILADCATNDGYAYSVTAAGLTEAFTSIAAAITALRLTN